MRAKIKTKPTLPLNKIDYWLLAILFLAVALRLISISFKFGDYDEGVYLATVRSFVSGHPLISQTYNSQGPVFIYLAAFFYKFSPTLVSVRLFPIICSVMIIYLTYALINKFFDKTTAILSAIYLSVDTFFLAPSRTFQVDVPWLAFSFVSFYLLIKFHETKKLSCVIFSALFLALGFFMKANPIMLVVTIFYFLFILPTRGLKYFGYIFYYLIFLLICLLIFVTPHNLSAFYLNTINVRTSHIGSRLYEWLTGTRFQLLSHERLLILLDAISLASAFFVSLRPPKNFFRWIDKNIFVFLSFVWFFVTIGAFSFYDPLFPHHFVFFILPAVLSAAYLVQKIYLWSGKLILGRVIFFLLVGYVLAYVALLNSPLSSVLFPQPSSYTRNLESAAQYVQKHSEKNDLVVSDDQLVLYLADRGTIPKLVDTSFVTINSGLLTKSETLKLIREYHPKLTVFISGRFASMPNFLQAMQKLYPETILPGGTLVFKTDQSYSIK